MRRRAKFPQIPPVPGSADFNQFDFVLRSGARARIAAIILSYGLSLPTQQLMEACLSRPSGVKTQEETNATLLCLSFLRQDEKARPTKRTSFSAVRSGCGIVQVMELQTA